MQTPVQSSSRADQLRSQISRLQDELTSLESNEEAADVDSTSLPLERSEYRRYGRQMILDGFGLQAQIKMKNAKVLVIGAGGLGCPLLLYLASAGVGHITVVDHDSVEISNLHRQVLHSQSSVGVPKAVSAQEALKRRNPSVHIEPIVAAFTPSLVTTLDFDSFDLALDCSDNPLTRYLLNDACVAHQKTLISGAAIRLDGQLVCWNLPPPAGAQSRGPCYRCVFPEVKDAESQRCEDEGVLGTVTGVIGTMMATEAIRYLTGQHDFQPKLTLYSAFSNPPFRTLRIKGKKDKCPACSASAEDLLKGHVAKESAGDWTFEACGIGEKVPLGNERISVKDLSQRIKNGEKLQLIDVRKQEEFSIASIEGSQNIPLHKLQQNLDLIELAQGDVITLCRRGNDSLVASRLLQGKGIQAKDVAGGLRAWANVHRDFPIY